MSKDGTMQPSAVTASLGLLRKVLPDLQSVDMKGKLEGRELREYSDAELMEIIAAAPPNEPAALALLPAPAKDKTEVH